MSSSDWQSSSQESLPIDPKSPDNFTSKWVEGISKESQEKKSEDGMKTIQELSEENISSRDQSNFRMTKLSKGSYLNNSIQSSYSAVNVSHS